MNRLIIAFVLSCVTLAAADLRWRLKYFYDKDDSEFAFSDLRFSSPERGIAVGAIRYKNGKVKPMALITRDSGKTWTEIELKDSPHSLFLLNDAVWWLVTEKGLWLSQESGRTWTRLKRIDHINRVYFRTPEQGWAFGGNKQFLATTDGGKKWTPVPAAVAIKTNPDYTSFDWLEFANPRQGILLGTSAPPRRGEIGSWMDPETLAKRREWPTLSIALDTNDSGATWRAQTAPTFGRVTRFRAASDGVGIMLIRFVHAFDWPSEVSLARPTTTTRIFRQKDRKVTDVAWMGPAAILAAVEPQGNLAQLPIPGKLHVLRSETMTQWTEMKVDFKAFASEAILSVLGPDSAWIATDTGQLLHLE